MHIYIHINVNIDIDIKTIYIYILTCIHTYICIYIYIYMNVNTDIDIKTTFILTLIRYCAGRLAGACTHESVQCIMSRTVCSSLTANLRTKILDFIGFDS